MDVPAFVSAIAAGDPERAGRIVFATNPLGASCARVCPVEVLCEGACVLLHEGRPPVAIGQLQRFATDSVLDRWALGAVPAPSTGRRVVVLGAGPAGLTAAAELARRGHAVTVLDERPEPGGLARYAIAPFRIRRQPLPAEVEQLQQLGVHIVLNRPISTPSELAKLERECDAVVLAVGMGPDTAVEYPNQGLEGVWESLQFIEQLKRGRPPRVGRQVVVIGGGNTAVDVAREAIRLGAGRATIAYRRTEAEMPAYRHEIAEARAEGVEIQFLVNPVRMLGTDRVTGVECQRMRLGSPDASGRPRPEPVPGEVFTLPADTVVKAIGQAPRLQLFREVGGLELDGDRLRVNPDTGRTSNPRYYAAGDVVNGGATVVEAVRWGKLVAGAIHDALSGEPR